MPVDQFAIPPYKPRFRRPFPTDQEDFIVLSDDDQYDQEDDTSTVASSPSPKKSENGSSSAQTTPSPSPAKKQKLVFGKVARPFTKKENQLIVDHLYQGCNLPTLQKDMDRARTTVVYQVERILKNGLDSVNKKLD